MYEFIILLSALFISLLLLGIEKYKFRKYAKIVKDILPSLFVYLNSNDGTVIVKDEDGKVFFVTKKKCIDNLDKFTPKRIESIESTKDNEMIIKGDSFETIDIIEKFATMQTNFCQTGFVKLPTGVYFFVSKKLCVGKKNYYLFIYQPEKSYIDLTEILNTLSNLKGISYSKYKKELVIFRSDEDFTIFKNHVKLKC